MDINSTSAQADQVITPVISQEIFSYVTGIGTIIILTLSFLGIFANIFNMTVFSTMGFQDSINVSLFGIALSDFCNNITSLGYGVFYNSWIAQGLGIPVSLIRAAMPLIVYPHLFFIKTTIMITTFVALERCLCVAMPMKVKLVFTSARAKQVMTFAFIFNPFITALLALGYNFGYKIDPSTNQSIFYISNIPERVAFFSNLLTFQIFFNFVGPYIFVSACTIILLTNLISKSNWRKDNAKSSATTASNSSNKDMKAAKMIVSVLILFIICTLPGMLLKFILVYVGKNLRATGPLYRMSFVIHTVVYIFNGINATCNILIYYNSSSKYKETFQKIYFKKTKE